MIVNKMKFKETEIGPIPEEWEVVAIEDIVDSVSDTFKFEDSDVVFLNTGDIYEGKILHSKKTNPEVLPGQAKKKIQKNDILFSEIRPANKRFAFVDFDTPNHVVSTKLMVLRTKNVVTPRFFYTYITSDSILKEFQVLAESRSGTFPQITFDAIRKNILALPSKIEQDKIADFILDIDNKIELNRKINANLENIASALFKQWFINIGDDIPEEWLLKPLDKTADFLNGLALQKYSAENPDEYLPVIKIRELKSGITDATDKTSTKIPSEYILQNGDVIFSWSGSLEVVIWCGGAGALNQHLFKVTSKKYPKWFYYQWIKYFLPSFKGIALDKAVTMGHIKRGHLTESSALVPDEKTLLKMDEIMNPIIEMVINNSIEIQNLSKMRDLLLPKLMSGKIRVK